ncbi:MAG: hypothetical protein HFG54_07870 [Lachnospiraceae bacterium]|nr:hypothetical protein [Lachnospiraceae bacterium]
MGLLKNLTNGCVPDAKERCKESVKMEKVKGRRAGRLAVLCLFVGIGAGILGGCKGGGQREVLSPALLPGQELPASPNQDFGDVPEAVGRYIETAVELPEIGANDRFVSFFKGKDNEMELYIASGDDLGRPAGARRFVWENNGWRQDEGWWDQVKPGDISVEIRRVFYGLDGKYYFSAMGTEEYIYHLYQINEEGESEELLKELFLPGAGKNYGMIPPKAEVSRDGKILIYGMDEATLYEPDGKRLFSMEKSWGGTSENSIGYMTEEEFVTMTEEGVIRYRLSDGQPIQVISFDGGNRLLSEEHCILFGDGDGGIYVAGEKGLAHVGAEGSLWELLMDGSLNAMGMQNIYCQEFLQGNEKDYYGVYVSDGGVGIEMYHYTYDPDMAASPPVTLTVYGLKDNSTVRQAAALFQKSHSDVRVEVLSSVEERGTPSEEMIRALNTELLNGKGADVLILDGLPWKSYEEKGILADMRQIFTDIQKEEPMMEQVVSDFTREDGGIYQMPARIGIPVVIGNELARQAFDNIETMAGYKGEKPLMAADTYENLLCLMANLQYQQLFDSREGDITEDLLVRYLETAKGIGEENGSRTMFTEEEMERLWVSNNKMPYGIRGTSINYDYGSCACGVENMLGLYDLIIPKAVLKKHPEASMESIHRIYFPRILIGVNQGSSKPELAREFVRCLFSVEVQKEEFFDGFPVNLRAQEENCISTGKNDISIGSGIGDYHISGEWPNTQERRELYEIIRSVSVPVMMDETIMNMIVDGARDYFDGKVSAREAAAFICRKITLYRAEQG